MMRTSNQRWPRVVPRLGLAGLIALLAILALVGLLDLSSSLPANQALAATPPQAPTGSYPREPLRDRVEDYVNAMLNGGRSAMVEIDDNYPVVYIVSDFKVDGIEALPDSSYRVHLRFKTSERISQNPESTPRISKVKVASEFAFSLIFKPRKGYLLWTRKLRTPFVRAGHEKRYLLPD